VLMKNKEFIPNYFKNASELLTKYSGTYTTCRTLDAFKIVDLPTHIHRLAQVGLSDPSNPRPISFIHVYDTVMPTVRQVLNYLQSIYQQNHLVAETRLTIILSFNPTTTLYDSIVLGEILPAPPKPPVIISIHKGERKNPEIKHTQWSIDRTSIAQFKRPDEEEIVLQGMDNGHLYEGLSSNFGVMKNGILYTSPKGTVLEGVTLDLIFRGCLEKDVSIVREFPNIDEISTWEGAFISSSTRCLSQVNVVRIGDREIKLPHSEILEQLSQNLIDQMRRTSWDINLSSDQISLKLEL